MQRVEIGPHVLYHADCREVLEQIEIDVMITDPPYSERTHLNARTNKGSPLRRTKEKLEHQGCKLVDFDHISDELFTGLTSLCLANTKRWVIMTCDHRHAALTFDWPEHIRLGAWIKPNPAPQISGDRPGSGHESILIMHGEGRKRWNGGGRAAIWRHNTMNSADIPTQKPIALLNDFVNLFSDAGEMVCDPFMGSGTTGVACANLGRTFIGIEIDERHFELSCRRIEYAESQLRLFA